ncbi:hypothetical protein ACGH2B_29510 [Streptomyces sp. BBFR2]|uniref:hypothetical protein n=1 Tax=Streptomyces sp. BBFR2 TaxID=3372854 RepID=UPI0037DA39B8
MTYNPSGLAKEAAEKISRLEKELASGRGVFSEPKSAVAIYQYLREMAERMPVILQHASAALEETTRDPDHAEKAVQCADAATVSATTLARRLQQAQEAAEKARRR